MLANGGELDGKRIISPEGFAELIKPNVVIPGRASHPQELQQSYALAWITSAYKGHLMASHSGSTNGFNSMVGFFPEENAAYALSDRHELDTPALNCLKYLLCDLLIGDVQDDYSFLIDIFNKRVNLGPNYTEEEKKTQPLSEGRRRKQCRPHQPQSRLRRDAVRLPGHGHLAPALIGLTWIRSSNYIGGDKFVGFEVLDTRTYRARFTEDGNLWMRLSTDAVCPIFFERF